MQWVLGGALGPRVRDRGPRLSPLCRAAPDPGHGDRAGGRAAPFPVAFSEAGAALGEFSDSWVDTLDNNRIQAGIWEDADRAFSVLARRIVDFVERN
jgi:hypothetical protein